MRFSSLNRSRFLSKRKTYAFEAARRLTGQEFSKKKTVEGGQTGECLEVSEFTTALSAGENQLRI